LPAFGNEISPDSGNTNRFRFDGEYFDWETGTIYLRARSYNPRTGRFTQPDPYLGLHNMIFGDEPRRINEREDLLGLHTYTMVPDIWAIMQSGNLYVYTINNPIFFNDPTGLKVNPIGVILGLGGGAALGRMVADHFGHTGWRRASIIAGFTVGGAIIGNFAPGLVNKLATQLSISMGSTALVKAGTVAGTLGVAKHQTWQAAEQWVRATFNAVKHTFNVPNMGTRFVDGFNQAKGIIHEVKWGTQSLTQAIQQQINKDAWLLRHGHVNEVVWHFHRSFITGLGGPTQPLLNELLRHGFKVIKH